MVKALIIKISMYALYNYTNLRRKWEAFKDVPLPFHFNVTIDVCVLDDAF